MAIIENKVKFCPECKSLLKPSSRGPVCRNPRCDNFVSFEEVPIQKKSEPVGYVPKEFAQESQESKLRRVQWCCPNAFFDVRTIFESMQFIGSIQSRVNEYFCYQYRDLYVGSTGLRELTRFNAIKREDLVFIENLINEVFYIPFTATQLRQACLDNDVNSERITAMKYLIQQNKEEHNELYWLMLYSCYFLTVQGKLKLQKHGHAIEFVKIIHNQPLIFGDNIFRNISYLFNINENTAVFKTGPFFLEVRCNGYRGSIGPYIDEEIDYLTALVNEYPIGKQLDITHLMHSMDYSHHFHRLYDLLGWKNIRNDRDETEFFERRIKSGLELVARLHKNLRVDKEGRTKIFIKS